MALGITAHARPPAKAADVHALSVVENAGAHLSEAERQYVLAVARGEGFYGRGWAPGEGAGSHNWGAVQGVGPAGSFMHLDHHADGTPYYAPFKAYNSDEEGFLDMAHILLRPNVRAALQKKSLRKAVFAQHANGYFELHPEKYLTAVKKNYNVLVSTLPIKKELSEYGTPWWALLLGYAVVGGGTAYYLSRRKHAK